MCEIANDPPRKIRPTSSATDQYQLPDDRPNDLSTIDVHAFAILTDEVATPLSCPATPAPTPADSVTPATPSAMNISEVAVGEEIIRTCLTPSKVKEVEAMLKMEKQRHLCALKLLQFFFTKQELSTSNTDETHGKQCLDRNKLNSLKALVFAKFPVEPSEKKEKIWRAIQGKINTKSG